jgi:hypothetical protein
VTGRTITVRVPITVRRRPGRKTVVTPDGSRWSGAPRADPAMVKALARGFRWKRMLDDGRYGAISEIAAAEKIDRGYVGSILRLTLLAPDVVEAILDGRQPEGLGLPELLKPFPLDWEQQRAKWGVAIERRRCTTAVRHHPRPQGTDGMPSTKSRPRPQGSSKW